MTNFFSNSGIALAILIIAVSLFDTSMTAGDWDYDKHGPSHWKDLFPQFCAGDRQSPIDLSEQTSLQEPLIKKFVFNQPAITGSVKLTLKNDGHKIELSWSNGLNVTMGQTASDQMYTAAQLHWHWGSVDLLGSEHTVAKKSYPAEGHLVFYNSKDYPDLATAASKPNGLAVLGVFYEVSSKDNQLLSVLDKALANDSLVYKDGVTELTVGSDFNMFTTFLPSNTDEFYRYDGSLTTPNCYETVLWTVYRQRVPISQHQLDLLRRLKFADNSSMVNNYRPPLPLNPGGRPGTPRTLYRTFNAATSIVHQPAAVLMAWMAAALAFLTRSDRV